MVARATRAGGAVLDTDFPAETKFDHLPETAARPGVTAFLTDPGRLRQVLHLLRRALYARRRVLAAGGRGARRGAAAGRRAARARSRCWARTSTPITARPPTAAPGASAACCARWPEIAGLERLRYTTSHPRDMDDALIAAHRDLPELMPFLHLPVQSGSDRMLAAMNRRHTADQYRRTVERLRRARTWRCPPISSSAFPARATRISPRRSLWCARSASPRPSRSNTAAARARRPRPRSRFRSRSRPSGSRRCRRCCTSSSAPSTTPRSGR